MTSYPNSSGTPSEVKGVNPQDHHDVRAITPTFEKPQWVATWYALYQKNGHLPAEEEKNWKTKFELFL